MDAASLAGKAPGFARKPDYALTVEPDRRRVRVTVGDEVIADSTRTMLLSEGRYPPVHYVPREDVRMDLLHPTDRRTHCPFKGDACHWSIHAGGREIGDAVWSYEHPFEEMAAIRGLLAFYPDKVDRIEVEGTAAD